MNEEVEEKERKKICKVIEFHVISIRVDLQLTKHTWWLGFKEGHSLASYVTILLNQAGSNL